jgi:hypothetical protein
MVGALAALPVASVPMLAHAAAANPDPNFALIEAAKGAKCALDVASKIDACLTNEVGTWDGVTITMRAPESLVQYGFGTYKALCRGELEETLDSWNHIWGVREAERAAALQKFDQARSVYEAKRESSGLNAAVKRWEELAGRKWDASDVVMKAKPQTTAGASALLLFTAERITENNLDLNAEYFLPALVNAARAIAGDGAPVKVSKELQEVLDGECV